MLASTWIVFNRSCKAVIEVPKCLLSISVRILPSCHVNKPQLSCQKKKDYIENSPVSPIKAILEQSIILMVVHW